LFLLKNKSVARAGRFFSFLKKVKNNIFPPATEDVNQQLLLKLNKNKLPKPSQLKQLPKFLSKGEKLQLLVVLLVFLATSLSLGWRFYLKNSISLAKNGGTYTEGLVGSPHLINPIIATNDVDRDLVKLIFSGLMKFDENGEIIPDLANGCITDAEQKVYTCELRPNLKWHDGQPLGVDDVIFTIASIKNSEYKSPLKNSFAGVTVTKINDQTVQFELEKPFAPFLSILTVGIIPSHAWYSIPAFSAPLSDLNIRPIGSGPYKFKSLTKDTSGNIKNYNLEAYEDYHFGRPYISDFNFKFYSDFDTAVMALQNKNVDGLIYLPKEYKNALSESKINFNNLQFPQYTAVFYNPNKNAMLKDNKFRQALTMSVDRQRILDEAVGGDGQLIDSPVLPGMTGYDENIKEPAYDPSGAGALLDELGWKMPASGQFRIKDKGNKEDEEDETPPEELSIRLTTIDQPENVKVVSIIKENWQAIGVKTELDIVSKEKMRKDIIEPRNYQALVYGEVINANSGPYPFWHSSQNQNPGLNLSVFANKDIDDYLDIIRSAKTEDEKLEPLANFQKKLLELNFAIFLYNPTYTYPTAKKLKGLDELKFINLPADRFNNVNAWYVKTKRIISSTEESN